MPYIQVCSLAKLADTVAATEASHVLTLINDRTPVTRRRRSMRSDTSTSQ